MAAVNTSVGVGGGGGADLTSGSVSPGGSDRVVLTADISDQGYSTDSKYGGSGGTSLGASIAQGLADSTIGAGYLNTRSAAGPSGSTTMYHLWGGATISASGSSLFLDGAGALTPLTQASGIGAGITNCSTGLLTGLTPGQLVIAAVGAYGVFGGNVNSIASGNADTTVYSPAYGTLSSGATAACAWMAGVADGAGELTLEADVNEAVATLFGWRVIPFAVADAGGGGALHETSGSLSAQAAAITGAADRTNSHNASGALVAQAATVSGAADRTNSHNASGSLVAQAATVAGAADRTNSHNASGSLIAQAATLTGAADRTNSHNASGSLVAQAATVAGAAERTNSHNASGSLVAQAASLVGTALAETPAGVHTSVGDLEARAAAISGSADLTSTIETSGALTAQTATVTGAASRTRAHNASGALAAQAATASGAAARQEAGTHDAVGGLAATAAAMAGTAVHVSSEGPTSAKFIGGGHKNVKFKPLKRQPASQEILQPDVTNVTHIEPPVRTRPLLDMLDLLPEPEAPAAPAPKLTAAPKTEAKKSAETSAPTPAPPPEKAPATPEPRETVDLSPVLAVNAALAQQVEALSTALAQTQATLQQLLDLQIQTAQATEKVSKATDAEARRRRNAARAAEITKKLLED